MSATARVLAIVAAIAVLAVAIASMVPHADPPPRPVPDDRREASAARGETFLAFARDFEDFRSWERIPIEGAMIPVGATPGPTAVYVNRRAPEGARRWPVGTMFVKTIENGEPSDWVIHAMVKRGVPYNRDGTIGWEFLELRVGRASGAMQIVWRGMGPPSGHGYAARGRDAGVGAVPLVCNDCHAAAWQSDGALTPALALSH
ncbi:MAG: hypothetical protein J0L92_30490 [Deltaproteobacteria bacterium]|nr:hypothetical protein [Deltaproteobacteria bacterium]